MRHFVLCACIFAALLGTRAASAQTYRTGAGPYGANFSGVEFGPDLAYGFGTAGPYATSGGALGGHLGYNLQNGNLVGGVEADALAANISTSQSGPFSFNTNFLGSLRGKAGYVFGNVMAYGTLGFGWGTADANNLFGTQSATLEGAAFGLGAEYSLTRNVSFRAEVMRYQFGDLTAGTLLPYVSQSINASTTLLRLGASVHF